MDTQEKTELEEVNEEIAQYEAEIEELERRLGDIRYCLAALRNRRVELMDDIPF